MKKITKVLALALSGVMVAQTGVLADFEWAKDAVTYCVDKGILSGMEDGDLALGDYLTREQMAKIMVDSFGLKPGNGVSFSDISADRWSYMYIQAFSDCMKKQFYAFAPTENVTREEFVASLVLASGLKEGNLRNPGMIDENFHDSSKVDSDYYKLVTIAVERGYYLGSSQYLRPKDLLNRAEACSLLYRVLGSKTGSVSLDLGVTQSKTPIIDEPACTLDEAKAWAASRGAHQRFIDIADLYWQYGELTGIRADFMYAQAAKETGFGKYGGAVKPEQNNWAGIKKYGATGDAPEDHEDFATPEDGVRGHFNHMSAYIGLAPIGEPHGRYYSVKSISWAGTVKYIEELGGKWCPDLYYGYSILKDYVEKM